MNGPNRRRLARRPFRANLAAGQSRKTSSTGSLPDPQSETMSCCGWYNRAGWNRATTTSWTFYGRCRQLANGLRSRLNRCHRCTEHAWQHRDGRAAAGSLRTVCGRGVCL